MTLVQSGSLDALDTSLDLNCLVLMCLLPVVASPLGYDTGCNECDLGAGIALQRLHKHRPCLRRRLESIQPAVCLLLRRRVVAIQRCNSCNKSL